MTQVPLLQNINLRSVTLFLTNKSISKTKSNITDPELCTQQYYIYVFSCLFVYSIVEYTVL